MWSHRSCSRPGCSALLGASQGRVITVTSGGMYSSGLDIDRLAAPDADGFDGVKAYARAKRAQVVLNEQWAARFGDDRGDVPRHAPRMGRHRGRALVPSALPSPGGADPALAGPGRRHHALAGVGRSASPDQRGAVAGPPSAPHRPSARHRGVGGDGEPALELVRLGLGRTTRAFRSSSRHARRLAAGRPPDHDHPSTGTRHAHRDRRHRHLRAGVCPPPPPPPRHHRVRVRRPRRRPHQHRAGRLSTAETHHVDTGFIVHNDRNYPNFVKLLDQLGVATQPSEMSFSVSRPADRPRVPGHEPQHALRPAAQPVPPVVPPHAGRHRAVQPSAAAAARRAASDAATTSAVARRLRSRDGRYSDAFVERFLVPLGASIWSADPATFTRFPAVAYARFMDNHGLLELSRHARSGAPSPAARSATSRRSPPRSPIASGCGAPVAQGRAAPRRRRRHRGRAHEPDRRPRDLRPGRSSPRHSDQALRLLATPAPAEREILGAIRYQPNVATLHTDERFLPAQPPGPGQLELPPRRAAATEPRR